MGYSELIDKLGALPDEKRAEVFDFVDYLATRFAIHRAPDVDHWTDLEFAERAMQQALRGMDDDPVIYGLEAQGLATGRGVGEAPGVVIAVADAIAAVGETRRGAPAQEVIGEAQAVGRARVGASRTVPYFSRSR